MARSYQRTIAISTTVLVADNATLGGGDNIYLRNAHATDSVTISGDENETSDTTAGGGTPLATSLTAGFVLPANATFPVPITLAGNEKIYARVSSGNTNTITIHVFRTNGQV